MQLQQFRPLELCTNTSFEPSPFKSVAFDLPNCLWPKRKEKLCAAKDSFCRFAVVFDYTELERLIRLFRIIALEDGYEVKRASLQTGFQSLFQPQPACGNLRDLGLKLCAHFRRGRGLRALAQERQRPLDDY